MVILEAVAFCDGFFCIFTSNLKNIIMKIYIAYFKDFGLSIYPFRTGFDLVLICVTFSVEFKKHANKSKTEDTEA